VGDRCGEGQSVCIFLRAQPLSVRIALLQTVGVYMGESLKLLLVCCMPNFSFGYSGLKMIINWNN